MALPNLSFLFGSPDDDSGSRGDSRAGRPRHPSIALVPSQDAISQKASATSERYQRNAAFVLRLRESDHDAFAAMFREHYASLVSFVRQYVGSVSDAEDIAQEAMVQVWERRATLDPERSLKAFLFTVGRHRALDIRRRRHVVARHEDTIRARDIQEQWLAVAPPADAELLADELGRFAAECVARLPARQREIFQLSRANGLSPAEIGDVLGIATQTVYVQLSRVTKTLYEALEAWIRDR